MGVISTFTSHQKDDVTEGRLEIGSAMQTALIKEVKKHKQKNSAIQIFDAPPGTSCPVVETVSDADFIILVSEPTPFGLHDLKITVDLLKNLQKPFGVIINKAGLGSNEIYGFLEQNHIEILGELPFSKKLASNYAAGNILENIPPEIEKTYLNIIEKIKAKTFSL